MTEKKTLMKRISERLPSMRVRFLFLILFGSLLAAAIYVLLQSSVHLYMQSVYQSEENRIERELSYVEDLQSFITENEITYEKVDSISRWMSEHRFVYLLIYKDDEIILRPPDDEDTPKDTEDADKGGDATEEDGEEGEGTPEDEDTKPPSEEDEAPSEGGESDAEENPDTDENIGTEGGGSMTEDSEEESTPPPSKPGGITVDYPTKEELYEYARSGKSYPLILKDGGSLSCSLAEYTEYFYYDMSNIVGLVLALVALATILIVYFYKVTSRIARLAKDVSTVSAGSMNHTIRSGESRDEITTLCRNVEQMRSSIVETLEKERAAVNANTELITSMSHDIRTPLTVLLGYLDIMSAETDDEQLLQYIQSAKQTANRLKNLSDEMFQYFLVFSDEQSPMQCESYDARTLLQQLFSEHVLLLEERGYHLVAEISDGFLNHAPQLFTNAPGCMRIVDNIFSNLTKYADKKSPVSLHLYEDDEYVYIEIENAVRADKESVESTGIGLKTCERIAKNTDMLFQKQEDGDSFRVVLGIPKAREVAQ